jgi:hypothetical protein
MSQPPCFPSLPPATYLRYLAHAQGKISELSVYLFCILRGGLLAETDQATPDTAPMSGLTTIRPPATLVPTANWIPALECHLPEGDQGRRVTAPRSNISIPNANYVEGPLSLEGENRQEETATKADDADIHVELWDNRVWGEGAAVIDQLHAFKMRFNHALFLRKFELQEPCSLAVLHHLAVSRWQRNIFLDLKAFMMCRFGRAWVDKVKGGHTGTKVRDALNRACRASFWEWKDGSALIFWPSWPDLQQDSACDGYPVWVTGELPQCRRRQRRESDPTFQGKIATKLHAVRGRRYIQRGLVKSLTSYFAIPKGETDVRIVYDASQSALNRCLWAPSFYLPSVEAHVQSTVEGSWMGNLDLGEMFLNFPLSLTLAPYCGIDLSPYVEESKSWERWERLMMGLKLSPY